MIARTPLCFGFLSGKVVSNAGFEKGDHRWGWSLEQRQRWAEGALRLFGDIGVPPGQTETQVALRFCLSFPAVSTVIPGILTPEQADENAAASDFGPLLPDQIERVRETNRHMGFFVSPSRAETLPA